MYKRILEKVEQTPFKPGCYIYRNSAGEVIYVGKAKSLRKRVRQYFDKNFYRDPKIEVLLSQIADLEWITVETETEALVLETNLIKKYRPKFNKLQKDDKQYSWIKITKEIFPRVIRTREQKNDGADYFGPYPNGVAARTTIIALRKIYPFRVCTKKMFDTAESSSIERFENDNKSFRYTKKSRLCLDYHLGLCSGCCDNLISLSKYNENIEDVRKFLKGKNFDALKELKSKMREYAINREFESAAEVRDQIQELMYVQQKIRVAYGEDEKEVQFKKEKEAFNTVKDLFEKLGIKEYSENLRMECYDVSNIQGTNPITSMVVFEKGLQKLSDYRYFNIRKKSTPDDFHMMEEALERRMKYLKQANLRDDKSFSSKPDLIIVDGGKGQLGIALDVVSKFELDINVVGIAKREEEIIQKKGSSYKIYKLRKDSKVLHLVQNIRDEAHRFAITRHRNLRGKKALESVLTQIPGVGSKTIENLIKNFGSIDAIRSANFEELNSVLENKSKCAEIIKFFK